MSEEWISARDAYKMVFPGKKLMGGPNAIIRRAKLGRVKARAAWLVKSGPGGGKEKDYSLPEEFWGGWSMTPDWEQGDFSSKFQLRGREEDWEASCVTFGRAEIVAMAPSSGVMAAPAPTQLPVKSKGGNPGKYDWAVAVGTIVFKWSDPGNWEPMDAKEIRSALEIHFADMQKSPDERLLRKYAEWIFQEIERRKE